MNTHLGYLLAISLAYTLVTGLPCAEHTFLAKQACFSKENLRHKKWNLGFLSYENGYSPRCNLTHNRVTRLVWWHT